MALTFSKKRQRRLPILRLLALALVALVLMLGSNAFSATKKERDALNNQIGRYQFESKGFRDARILDTITGQIRLCFVDTDKDWTKERILKCHDWSEDDRDKFGK